MQLVLRFLGFAPRRSAIRFAESTLAKALRRFDREVTAAQMYIEDVNGPRGGADKECRCVIQLRKLPPVVIRDRDTSVTTLVQRVVSRAGYAVNQKLERRARRRFPNCRLEQL